MKQRVTALDLQILTKELEDELLDYRLANIYNITTSNRQYLLKFAIPDSKKNLVLDSGFKAHLTEFSRPTPQTPSPFVTKLRKHLKTRRLSSIKQVGIDRVVVMTFSDGAYHLALEFFSAGNIVLLDDQRRIMALQRLVEEKGNNDRYAVGETYNLFDDSLFDESDDVNSSSNKTYTADEIKEWINDKKDTEAKPVDGKKKLKVLSIQKILYQKAPHLSADMIGKVLNDHGINPSASSLEFLDQTDLIAQVLSKVQNEIQSIINSKTVTGYILTKENPLYDPSKDEEDLKFLYDQFHPFSPLLKSDKEATIEVEGYNKTLDKFFSTIESSKYALRIQNQENQAKKKIEQARNDKHQQVQRLIDVQEVNKLKGETIIFNAHLVEEAKAAVQALLDQSMDWQTMEKLIKVEKAKGNSVAGLINLPLNLKQNKISLNLLTEEAYEEERDEDQDDADSDDSDTESDSDSDEDDDDDSVSHPKKQKKQEKVKNSINVTIDIGLSAYANASEYFTVKKNTVEKQKKVEQSTTRALKNIEHKIAKDLKKNLKQETEVLRKLRTPYFFEKFNWFISNENYLVLSGKDDSQTDMIYHRYITKDDIYVFADVDGASHVFIKNPNKGEVSPSTLTQAGIMALSTSKAWENKMVTSAWWCYASDITKNDIDGKILKTGSFRYLKEKNFLPPSQLVMGFAFVWRVKTEKNERELEEQLEELENLDIGDVIEDQGDEQPVGEEGSKEEEENTTVAENGDDDEEVSEQEEQNKNDDGQDEEEPIQDAEPEGEAEEINEGGDDDDQEQAEGEEKEEEDDGQAEFPRGDRSDAYSTFSKATSAGKKSTRGKKGKKKKAEKYADQDAEDRRLRMEVLGTLKQQAKREEELKQQQLQKISYMKKIEKKKRQEEDIANKYSNKKEVIDYESILDELRPTIAQKDEILEAIPVFAPWNALTKYRYRVKIQPGSTKKGKAIQETLHFFNIRPTASNENDRTFDWVREHDVIKGMKDTELLPTLYVGKLKVLLPGQAGAPKAKTNAKGGKRGKKK